MRMIIRMTVTAMAIALAVTVWADDHEVDVIVPELSSEAQEGRAAFGQFCAECHGATAGGTAMGPPLVHPLYVPSHHGDMAFVLAARQGVRAHHWGFGDMEPVPDISDEALMVIIRYVRELQEANGIR